MALSEKLAARLALVAALALIALASGRPALGAEPSPGKKFGKSDPGKGVALAQGTARNPRGLFLRVTGTPGLVVSATTVVECTRKHKSTEVGGVSDGAFNAVAPLTRKLGQTVKRPDRCFVSVVVTYEQGSKDPLRAQLFARHRKH